MEGWQMYSRIQGLKGQGFSQRQVSRIVRIARNTISKYWEMEPHAYAARYQAVQRMTALMAYEAIVIKWLETYPCMTAAQVRDWLEEKYQLDVADRTVRRFVVKLREEHGISKEAEPRREYEAVEELPKGYQMQLDFGEKTVRDTYSSRYIKLYFVIFTLSHSRYKWGTFQTKPFLSGELVQALWRCFEYFGGMPRQLVYDQDSIIVVSENNGDIIHTQAFAAFLAETKLEVRVCRKSDPESKGLIEASVKFVKRNFMENRYYMGLDNWNQSFEDWLDRTGNGRQHGTTKRKPVDMFAEEQIHLLPLYGTAPAKAAEEMYRNVRPDNTILYKSNRYSVPYGTYSKEKKVFLAVEDGNLEIMDRAGDTLATHEICGEKGKLVRPESHRRDKSERIKALLDKKVALLGEEFREYLELLCEKMPRYAKDQLELVLKICEAYGRENILEAIAYCRELSLFSANDLHDVAVALGGQESIQPHFQQLPVQNERYHIAVQKRDLSLYTQAATGSVVTQ